MKYKLFTTQFCHKCPQMKELLSSQTKVSGEIINASTPDGLEQARRFNVTGVPLVVFLDDDSNEVKRFSEKEEVKEFITKI
jgi:hypothetical protein